MRVLVRFEPVRYVPFNKVNKHTIQGMLYDTLWGTRYEALHKKRGFKFFTYSDIFPAKDFYPGKEYSLIVSSPWRGLVETWYRQFRSRKYVYLSDSPFLIKNVKKFDLPLKNEFITGSPIFVRLDKDGNRDFSFKKHGDLLFFLERIKENAIKKFNAFYDDEYHLDGALFDALSMKKEMIVRIKIKDKPVDVVATTWNLLKKSYLEKEDEKFYKFVMDAGLGEKNSLGFGLLNPRKVG